MRVAEANVVCGPVGGAGGVAGPDLAQVADEQACGVGAAQGCCCCPQGCGVAVQATASSGQSEAGQVADAGNMSG